MFDANHMDLARFMRALRLQNPYPADSEAFLGFCLGIDIVVSRSLPTLPCFE